MKAKLGYALHTLVGPWLLLPAIVLEVVAFLQRGMPWRGEGMWTADWFAVVLFILGPVSAGVAAVDAARLTRPGNIHLVLSVPRPERVYLRAALWTAVPLAAAHVATIAVALLVGEVRQPSAGWWAIMASASVQVLAIFWYVALGSALGRFASPLVAGLLGAVSSFVLNYTLSNAFDSDQQFRLLKFGGATITLLGRTYNLAYLGGQAILLSLTALLLVTVRLRARSGLRIPSAAGWAAACAAVGLLAFGPALFPNNRQVDVPVPPDVCVGDAPQICLFDEHRRHSGLVVPQVQQLMASAKEKGYHALVPQRVVEQSRTYIPSGPDVQRLWLPAEVYEQGQLPVELLVESLIAPWHCHELRPGVDPMSVDLDWQAYHSRYFSLFMTWMQIAGHRLDRPVPAEFRVLNPAEAQAMVEDFQRCELDGRG
ncbi:hypothetical protein AB0B66_22480 [Catellatospora sp. NPDC049111]|uniref:hypothetical protein n=1 Tax=Catellatospora sp. NPDC049111 TaxID=3155271 RepID=UPI0033DFC890